MVCSNALQRHRALQVVTFLAEATVCRSEGHEMLSNIMAASCPWVQRQESHEQSSDPSCFRWEVQAVKTAALLLYHCKLLPSLGRLLKTQLAARCQRSHKCVQVLEMHAYCAGKTSLCKALAQKLAIRLVER